MKKLLTTITAALILACGCTTGGEAIMKVNGEVITKKQFDQVFDEFMGSSPFFAGNKDSIKNSKDNLLYGIFKDKVVNELIYATLLKQETAAVRLVSISNGSKEINKKVTATIAE